MIPGAQTRKRATRVVIVDDDPRVLSSLRSVLELDSALDVAGVAMDAAQALARDAETHPDVVLVDVRLPDETDGLNLIRRLTLRGRTVVAFSAVASLRFAATEAGAALFLEKGPYFLDRLVRGITDLRQMT